MAQSQSKNLTKFILLGAAIAAVIFLILRLNKNGPGAVVMGDEVTPIAPITLDSSFFIGQKFKNLRGYGQYPVRPGIMGRENPFLEPTRGELKAMGVAGSSR